MTKYLVTGGAGFIGSHIVDALVGNGEEVRVLDNLSTGSKENLAGIENRIDFVQGDIRSYHLVTEAVHGVKYVIHQAALPSVPRSVRDPITTAEVNIMGTLNVLYAAKEAGVRRVIFASSSSVYGDNPALPKQEDMLPMPLSPYAVSKLSGEQNCQVFWRVYGLETICLRYFNVFGPRQNPESQYAAVIPKFITSMIARQPVTVHGDGRQSRDFTYVQNVVQANLLACSAPEAAGRVLNIACGKRYSLLELIAELSTLCGVEPDAMHTPPRIGDVPHSQADISCARAVLGYEPDVAFTQGLKRTVDWYRGEQL